jgi:hypothetical protein
MIEVTGTCRRKHMQLLYDLKEMGRYWKLNEEALDHLFFFFFQLYNSL